jgi:hydroxymethylbilane synthase
VIATSAPRRRAQILARHPRLRVDAVRGNVETRVGKLRDGSYDGMVLATAGLMRLGRANDIVSSFSVDEMIPAAGQGIVALESLRANMLARDAAAAINHARSALAAQCERGVLQQFGTRLDCTSCIAVHASSDGGEITIRAFVSDPDGTAALHVTQKDMDAEAVVKRVADELFDRGAIALLEAS